MIIVIDNTKFHQEKHVFDFLFQAEQWAEKNGFTLVHSGSVSHIYYVTF